MKVNIEGFASNMGLEPKDIKSLYSTFFTEMNENIILLKNAVKEEENESIKDIMHNIKGVCLNLEINELGKYADQTYTETKKGDFSNIDKFISYFDTEIIVISKIISDYYEQ